MRAKERETAWTIVRGFQISAVVCVGIQGQSVDTETSYPVLFKILLPSAMTSGNRCGSGGESGGESGGGLNKDDGVESKKHFILVMHTPKCSPRTVAHVNAHDPQPQEAVQDVVISGRWPGLPRDSKPRTSDCAKRLLSN